MKFIKTITISLMLLFSFSTILLPHPTFAANDQCSSIPNDAPDEVKQAAGCQPSSTESDLAGIVTGILNTIISVSGIVAVIFIIVGGVNYMTSVGEPTKIEKAKKTILYAAIGLAICALSFAIVNFVILKLLEQPQ